jgi:hypothetical protein
MNCGVLSTSGSGDIYFMFAYQIERAALTETVEKDIAVQ